MLRNNFQMFDPCMSMFPHEPDHAVLEHRRCLKIWCRPLRLNSVF